MKKRILLVVFVSGVIFGIVVVIVNVDDFDLKIVVIDLVINILLG